MEFLLRTEVGVNWIKGSILIGSDFLGTSSLTSSKTLDKRIVGQLEVLFSEGFYFDRWGVVKNLSSVLDF
jgi:hypothetical protein